MKLLIEIDPDGIFEFLESYIGCVCEQQEAVSAAVNNDDPNESRRLSERVDIARERTKEAEFRLAGEFAETLFAGRVTAEAKKD
jgi:hypothetical protein